MAIRVSLHPNVLAKDGSQFARVVSPIRIGFETLLDYMVKDTGLARNDMRSVLEQFREAICYHRKMGHRVETPVGSFHPGVSAGIVRTNGHIPSVSPARLRVNFVPHTGLVREFRSGARLQMEEFTGFAQPLLMHMSNVDNEIEDVHFSPGTLCKMVGAKMSFDKTIPQTGLFFVNVDSPKKGGAYLKLQPHGNAIHRLSDSTGHARGKLPGGTAHVELQRGASQLDLRQDHSRTLEA